MLPERRAEVSPGGLHYTAPRESEQGQAGNRQQDAARLGDDCTVQRKRLIEGGERRASDDILAHTQPVRIEELVTSPALQVR